MKLDTDVERRVIVKTRSLAERNIRICILMPQENDWILYRNL